MGPKNRIGKIFIDYLRNSRGASTVCAFSVRARPGLPISLPIAREELSEISRPDMTTLGLPPVLICRLPKPASEVITLLMYFLG